MGWAKPDLPQRRQPDNHPKHVADDPSRSPSQRIRVRCPRQAPCGARRSRYRPANLIAFARHGQPTFCPGFPIGQPLWGQPQRG